MPWSKNATKEMKSEVYKNYYYRNREAQLQKSRLRYENMTDAQRQSYKEKQKRYAAKYKEDERYKGKYKNKKYKPTAEAHILDNARARAKEKGLPFNLTVKDISIPKICPVLGIPIERKPGVTHAGTPSIDRLIPAWGYVKGNVWIISFRANEIKKNCTSDELFKVARAVQLIEEHSRSIVR